MPTSSRSDTIGLMRVAFAATVWGTIPLLVRQVDTSPLVIVFWRVIFAGAVVLTYVLVRGRLREVAAMPRKRKLAILGMGALLAVNWVLFLGAYQLADVAVVALLGYLGPVIVAAMNPLVLKERFDRRIIVPLSLSLLGTIVILGPRGITLGGGAQSLGILMALASAFTYAFLVLNARRLVQGVPMSLYMLGEYVAAAALLLPAAILLPGPQGIVEWGSLGVLGTVHTATTGLLILSALRTVRADRVAIVTYAEPVSAVIFGALVLGESLTLSTVLGGIAVLAGGVLVARMEPVPGIEAPDPKVESIT